VGDGVASGHGEPELVAGRDGFDGHEEPGGVRIVQAHAIALELLHTVHRPATLDLDGAPSGVGSGLGQ